MSIESEYNEAVRAAQRTCHEERPPQLPEGVRWSYCRWSQSETPYLRATCSDCKVTFTTESADPKFAVFKHCGDNDGSIFPWNNPPKEMLERLVKEQIAKGIRRAPSMVQRITGEVPSLVKVF
jgi:hypothetical protein